MPSRTNCTALCFMIATIAISFAGCKVGPNFARPWTRVNDNWAISSRPEYYGNPTDVSQWWLHLNDPTLTELICTARMQNLSIQEAGARVLEARYRQAVATGNLLPQAQAGVGSFSNAKTSSNVANFFSIPGIFTPNTHPQNWQVGLQASWELDFWGRYRRIIEAAEATTCEREAIHQDVMVLVCSEVAAAYVEIRSLEAQMELASRNLEIQQRTLKIAEDKLNAGLGNAIDVAQARTILGQTESVIPGLEIRRRQSNHRLCLLLGYPPADLTGAAGATGTIPEPSINLAFGIPADLLRRRPDVRAAERRLAAQSAKIGVAEAEFYPHISLLGSIGYSAEDFGKLFDRRSSTGLIAPGFSWNILQYGRIRNNVEAEKAAFTSFAFGYQQSVLEAQREVEDAQVAYVLGFDKLRAVDSSVTAAATAVEKAEASYREGAIDYGRVYVLQTELLKQQIAAVQTKAEIVRNLIVVFQALGGGWQCTPDVASGTAQVIPSNVGVPMPSIIEPSSFRNF